MQPKTKFQKMIVGYSKKLKPISEKQKKWAIHACTENYAVVSRKTTYCLECGHTWKEHLELVTLLEHCVCPNCDNKLKYHSQKRIDKEATYFAILITKKGMQVVRMFLITKYFKKKQQPSFSFNEVMQHWIALDGRMETLNKPVNSMSYYYDLWSSGELEIRTPSRAHNLRCDIQPYKIYPVRRVLPILKRNGFKGYFHGLCPQKLFNLLLTSNIAETFFKTRQFKLLKSIKHSTDNIERYWKSIRICMRYNYIVKDATIWFDYLNLLEYFGKDLLNPKYVCPVDLFSEHDKLVLKKSKLEGHKKKIEYQERYIQEKGMFFNLYFQEENITISPLKSIDDFIEEGHSLKHCVYTNEYFKKKNSLVMSARINGKSIETIEISISNLSIIQSRGLSNKISKYNDKIINIVEKNFHQIEKAMAC